MNYLPDELKHFNQWVAFQLPHKKPINIRTGYGADSTDRSTWSTFEEAVASSSSYDGIGFVFSEDDAYVGVDLDGCRSPDTGVIEIWAKYIIKKLDSYAEVSPSGTGVKIWCKGESPYKTGKNFKDLCVEAPPGVTKKPGIEVYDRERYFCVTGQRVKGFEEIRMVESSLIECLVNEVIERREEKKVFQPKANAANSSSDLMTRAGKYLAKMPEAVSGSGGDAATFKAACALVIGFGLAERDAMDLMRSYSDRCQPPWTERELLHKVRSAAKVDDGSRWLMDGNDEEEYRPIQFGKFKDPSTEKAKPNPNKQEDDGGIEVTSLLDETVGYLESLKNEEPVLLQTGIVELDHSIGGIDLGELVIVAGRPSHGKSAIGMQFMHAFAAQGQKCLVISEEMSKQTVAKRTVQFASNVSSSQWRSNIEKIRSDIEVHFNERESIYVATDVRTAANAYQVCEQARDELGVTAVMIDYAQLLGSNGNGRYEQVTNTSLMLSKVSRSLGLTAVVLCQCNRQIESRGRTKDLVPTMSDLSGSGQLEQDADVILFGVWPCRIKPDLDPDVYVISAAKNRNREINNPLIKCVFDARRMKVNSFVTPEHVSEFDDYDNE